jgi:hypothetical protein
VVEGLYAAMVEQERARCSRPDPRLMRRLHPEGGYCTSPGVVCEHEPIPTPASRLLRALEAGDPVVVEGRNLRGRSVPDVKLRRDQAFAWFEVRSDDTVRPAAPPE